MHNPEVSLHTAGYVLIIHETLSSSMQRVQLCHFGTGGCQWLVLVCSLCLWHTLKFYYHARKKTISRNTKKNNGDNVVLGLNGIEVLGKEFILSLAAGA